MPLIRCVGPDIIYCDNHNDDEESFLLPQVWVKKYKFSTTYRSGLLKVGFRKYLGVRRSIVSDKIYVMAASG